MRGSGGRGAILLWTGSNTLKIVSSKRPLAFPLLATSLVSWLQQLSFHTNKLLISAKTRMAKYFSNFLPEVVFQHPQAGALVEMVWLWSLLEEDTVHTPLERTQSPQHTVGYKTKIKDKRKLSQASRKCNQISIQSVMAWLQASRHEISLFQAFNHSREIPITAEHKSILVTCTRSTSSPEEDRQYEVETLRSTSKVTTNDYISLLTPSRS